MSNDPNNTEISILLAPKKNIILFSHDNIGRGLYMEQNWLKYYSIILITNFQ